ncbi:MAG: TPM domain-containing protein [Candidatus Limnocylindrales bacterium]
MTLVDRVRTLLRPAVLAGGLLFLLVSGTAAQSTPTLTSQITDQTGVLGSGRPQVQAALDDLLNRENVELWVVLVPTTSGTTAQQFAQETFERNGLGGNDLLLLVAVGDHRYGWWEVAATGLPGDQIDSLLGSQMESRFKAGDYPGGIADFASALSKQIEAARTPGAASSADYSAIVTALWTILAIILIGSGVVVVALWFLSWRRGRLSAEERDKHTGELARQANKLLVDTDDAVNEAQQELGFAEAEFDEGDTKPFRDAIATAQNELKKAFAVRQQLDDATPEDQPTKEKMYGEIIAGCQAASAVIDEQAGRLKALRDLEKTAPQALAALPNAIEALQARLPAIRAAMKTLSGYAPSAWRAVKGNAEEADKRGHFAEQQIEKGKAAVAAAPPDSHAAAHAARAAQEAVAQANQLLDAVEQMAAALEEARGKLEGEIAGAEADIAAAKSAAQGSGAPAGATAGASAGAGDLAKAETLLKAAKSQAAATTPDTIAALKAAQDAHASADTALAGIREASSQQARVKAAFDAARASAGTSVNQARAFIGTRRNGVGREARTKLAEAERHLSLADSLAATDLSTATTEARVAANMATAAYNLASGDFVDFERGSTPRGGGGYSGGGGGSNIAGAILGGIIGGMLSGGRGGGGFGGTRWGSGGGWTAGGGGSGGSGGGGSFGGFGGFGGGHGGGGGWSGGGGGGGGHGGGGGW